MKNHITLMYKYSIIIFIQNLNNMSCLSSYKIIFYQKKEKKNYYNISILKASKYFSYFQKRK